MANRSFYQFSLTAQRDVVTLTAKVTIGAVGAPTLSTTDAKAIKSITRNSAGNYTLALQDNYAALMSAAIMVMNPIISTAPDRQLISEQVSSATAPQLVFQMISPAGAAVDPDSGATILVTLLLRNAST